MFLDSGCETAEEKRDVCLVAPYEANLLFPFRYYASSIWYARNIPLLIVAMGRTNMSIRFHLTPYHTKERLGLLGGWLSFQPSFVAAPPGGRKFWVISSRKKCH